MNTILNRRLFIQLLSLLPFLRKLMEPALEVVQPPLLEGDCPDLHFGLNGCRCAHCSYLREKYWLNTNAFFVSTPRSVVRNTAE